MADYPRYDYFSNTLNRTYPRGMDVEIFKRRALEQAHEEAFLSDEREHVTPYLYKHPELFALGEFFYERDESDHRWTVDTLEDFQLIQTMMETLYPLKRDFSLEDLLELSLSHPEWKQINAHIQQKKF
jgi:spore coat polysaccharide biosynthesis protein SpsF